MDDNQEINNEGQQPNNDNVNFMHHEDEMFYEGDDYEEEEFGEIVWNLGHLNCISSEELCKLITSEDSKDKEKLKLIVNVALAENRDSIIRYLLSYEYQLEVLNDKNQTITHLIYYDNTDRYNLIWILNLGFSNNVNHTNYVDSNGLSLLHIACATGYVDVVKQFLDNGEEVNISLTSECRGNRSGSTPLHLAVANQELEIVKLLLEHGADVNAANSFGCTPLHLVCAIPKIFTKYPDVIALKNSRGWNNELKILELLLMCKRDLNVRNNDGNTPAFNIFMNDYYDCSSDTDKILIPNHVQQDRLAIHLQHRQLCKFGMLWKHDPNIINVKNDNDESILHRMMKDLKFTRYYLLPIPIAYHDEAFADLIQALLRVKSELDVNAKNKQGETPLSLAVSMISYELVKILLIHDADVNSIVIDSYKFFKYPKVIPMVDVVYNLKSIMTLLIEKGIIISLEADLEIMKFITHDVEDCDCQNVIQDDMNLFVTVFHFLSHSSLAHLKQVFVKMCENLDEGWKLKLLQCTRTFLEISKLIPYTMPMDEEILKIVYDSSQAFTHESSIMQMLQKDLIQVNSTKLKNNVTLFDLLTKYSNKTNILKNFDCNDAKAVMEMPVSGNIFRGVIQKSLVRIYVESAAYKGYIGLLIPFLPDLCREIILRHLETEDILRLCKAALLD